MSTAFDWKTLVATDPRYAAQDDPGARVAGGPPAEEWKTAVLAAYLRDDQLRESSRDAETRLGLVPGLAAGLKLVGGALFGFRVEGAKAPASDLVIGPEECALVIRDGEILGTYSQARVVRGEGFLSWLRALVGAVPNYRILLVDAAPFEVRLGFGPGSTTTMLVTKDDEVLSGHLTARMQFDVENLQNVLGLLKGRTLLHRQHVARQIAEVVFARVLVPLVREHLAADVRANLPLQDKIRGEVQRAVEGTYRDVGLLVRNLTVSWQVTEGERAAIDRKHREREHETRAHERELAAREEEVQAKAEQIARKRALLDEAELAKVRAESEVEKAEAEARLAAVRRDMERLEAEHGLLIRARREAQEIHQQEEALRVQREDELAREEGRSRAAAGAEAARVEAYRGLTPEQILAVQAASSAEAAQALAERYRAEAAAAASSDERVGEMARAIGDQMANVARAAAGAPERARGTCPKCGDEVEAGWRRCPMCGSKLAGRA